MLAESNKSLPVLSLAKNCCPHQAPWLSHMHYIWLCTELLLRLQIKWPARSTYCLVMLSQYSLAVYVKLKSSLYRKSKSYYTWIPSIKNPSLLGGKNCKCNLPQASWKIIAKLKLKQIPFDPLGPGSGQKLWGEPCELKSASIKTWKGKLTLMPAIYK